MKSNEIEWINPEQLLCVNRFYIALKYKYTEMLDKHCESEWVPKVYWEHLYAFSNGTFIEPDQPDTKKSYEKYIQTFYDLYRSIKAGGVDSNISCIPVSKDYISLDGSHRIGISLYFGKKVPIIKLDEIPFYWDYNCFLKRGMPQQSVEYMVNLYCKLKKNVYVMILWPKLCSKRMKSKYQEAKDLIQSECKIVYHKRVKFRYGGIKNLVIEAYWGKEWLGDEKDDYKGAEVEAEMISSRLLNNDLEVFVLEDDDKEHIDRIKDRIRKISGLENAACHSTDTKEESMRLINVLLNENTIDMLNHYNPYTNGGVNLGNVLIDSSGVLGIYGIRTPGDFDYLLSGGEDISDEIKQAVGAENHEDDLRYHSCSKYDLFENPYNHVYYMGIKFLSLQALKRFKETRGSMKDLNDVRLLTRVCNMCNKRINKRKCIRHEQ